MPGASLVLLRDVTFRYPAGQGGVSSFDVPTGQVTALTGPSFAGKSTTADLVLGLLEPDSGQVLIEGNRCPGPGCARGGRASGTCRRRRS